MFDWVLNAPLNAMEKIFPGVSKSKLKTFSVFFQRLTFPTNTLSEAKAYLEPRQTCYNGAFTQNTFLQNS